MTKPEQTYVIFKHKLPVPDANNEAWIQLPKDAQILCVKTLQAFPDEVYLYVRQSRQQDQSEVRRFLVVPTGMEIDAAKKTYYIGTFTLDHDHYVFHLFELV